MTSDLGLLRWRVRARASRDISGGCNFPYQPYNFHYKLIFVHIPKCGGTSLLNALVGKNNYIRRHLPSYIYQQADSRAFKEFFKFSIVRDPIDRLRSAYHYLLHGGNGAHDLRYLERFRALDIRTFDHFIDRYVTPARLYIDTFLTPQKIYICDADGNFKVDRCWSISRLKEAALTLADYLERPVEIGHYNRSTGSSEMVSDECRQKISELYKSDFDMLKRVCQSSDCSDFFT